MNIDHVLTFPCVLLLFVSCFWDVANGDEPLECELVKQLNSPDVETRIEASRSLFRQRKERIRILIGIVNKPIVEGERFDHAADRRSIAILLLGQMRAKQAVEDLIPWLVIREGQTTPNFFRPRFLSFAGHSLAAIGEPAVGPLLETMKNSSEDDISQECFKVLVKIYGFEEAADILSRCIRNAEGRDKRNLREVQASVVDAGVPWNALRKEEPPWVRIAAAAIKKNAGVVKAPAAEDIDVDTLISRIQNSEVEVGKRLQLAHQLIRLEPQRVNVAALFETMLDDPEHSEYWRAHCVRFACDATKNRKERQKLKEQLLRLGLDKKTPAKVRNAIVSQIGYLKVSDGVAKSAGVLKLMRETLRRASADSRTRSHALWMISRLGDESDLALVRTFLNQECSRGVKLASISVLKSLGKPSDLAFLEGMLEVPDRVVAERAASAIKAIQKRSSVD